MAYNENTGVSTPQDLINAICTFVAANGWTVERNNLVGSNRTATIRLVGVTDYIHLYNVATDQIQMRISIGYDGGAAANAQPNQQPFSTRVNGLAGPYPRVYFMMEDDAVNIVVESSLANQWRHIAFGCLEKYGTYDGGTYVEGTWRGTTFLGDYTNSGAHHIPFGAGVAPTSDNTPYPGCVRADDVEGSRTNFFHWFGDGGSNATYGRAHCGITSWANVGGASANWLGRLHGGADLNAFSGRSVPHPIIVFVDRTGSPLYRSPIGAVKNMRLVNMTKFNNAQEIIVGGETWKMFPALKKSMITASGSGAADYGTHTLGYAIKKVA